MIKLVAFDWNGTLLADTHINLECSNLNNKIFGLKPINLKQFREMFQIPSSLFWFARGGKKKDLPKVANNFHKFYEDKVNRTRTRRGSIEILKYLKQKKNQSIIYSNHTIQDIAKQLTRLNVSKYFGQVLARTPEDGHSQVYKRTKDLRLHSYIKKIALKPKEILTIGDTEEEIEIGKKYGYHTVAITGGYNTTARLKKHHPDFLIHNMLELKKIIKKLNQA